MNRGDSYFNDSLKGTRRSNRWVSVRFPFNHVILKISAGRHLITTYYSGVFASQTIDTSSLMPCTTEEAGKRVFIPASDVSKDFNKLLIKSVYQLAYVMETVRCQAKREYCLPKIG